MPKVKTFAEACEHLQLDPATCLPDFSSFPQHHQAAMTAHAKLVIIAEALNDGWRPNWNNRLENKWIPWFDMGNAGVGFSLKYYVSWYSLANVGSRLCFKSRDLAAYSGTQFLDLYKDYFTYQN